MNAFRTPPFFSISFAICSFDLVLVPVKSKCSMKWATPFILDSSKAAPNLFVIESETNGKSRDSWIMVIPFCKTLRWKFMNMVEKGGI